MCVCERERERERERELMGKRLFSRGYKVYGCAYVPTWVDECLRVLEGYVGGCVGGSVCVCVFAHVCVLLRTLCVCC